MHITPYKAIYFPNFIFLRKRLKSSHTSLKKLEKEDFNSINRYFISSLGDASPPGEDALPAGEDAFLTRAYIRVHNIYLETFFCSMFHFHNTMH